MKLASTSFLFALLIVTPFVAAEDQQITGELPPPPPSGFGGKKYQVGIKSFY